MIIVNNKENLTLDFYKELYPSETSGIFLEYKLIDLDTHEEYIFASNNNVIYSSSKNNANNHKERETNIIRFKINKFFII